MPTSDPIIDTPSINQRTAGNLARKEIRQRQKFHKYFTDLLQQITDEELQNLFNNKDYMTILFLKDEPDLGYWNSEEYNKAGKFYLKIKKFIDSSDDIDPQ